MVLPYIEVIEVGVVYTSLTVGLLTMFLARLAYLRVLIVSL